MIASVDCINDPAIPRLGAVSDAAALREHLCGSLPWQVRGVEQLRVHPLRHHAGKGCVVEIKWQGSLDLIGKVYAKDRSDVYRLIPDPPGALPVFPARADYPPPDRALPMDGATQVADRLEELQEEGPYAAAA